MRADICKDNAIVEKYIRGYEALIEALIQDTKVLSSVDALAVFGKILKTNKDLAVMLLKHNKANPFFNSRASRAALDAIPLGGYEIPPALS